MKTFYFLLFILFASSCTNKQRQQDKLLIELNESKQETVRLQHKLQQLQDELDNCKLNYSATDEVSPTSATSQ